MFTYTWPVKRREGNAVGWMTDLFRNQGNEGTSGIACDLKFQHVSGQYKNFTRMTPSDFEHLLCLVGKDITKKDTHLRCAISAQSRLAITLRFLASGDSYTSPQYLFRVSKQSISKIVPETCRAIVNALKREGCIKVPGDKRELEDVAEDFYTKWNFPHCVGSLDGKHILIKAPRNSAAVYYNFKNYFSNILFAAVDANYNFIFVDIGKQGSLGDSTVFSQCWLGRELFEGKLNFPDPKPLTEGRSMEVPYCFIGDEAFPLKSNLMRAYAGYNKPGTSKRVFNYRLCRARRVVENVFGIVASVFRILRRPIDLEPDEAQVLVLCIAYLHNFLQKSNSRNLYIPPGCLDREDDGNFVEGSWRQGGSSLGALGPLKRVPRKPTISAEMIRDEISNYFIKEGKLSWQDRE